MKFEGGKCKKMMKSKLIGFLAILFVSTGVFAQDMLIRGNINAPDGTNIKFSVPVQVLEAIKTSGISAMMQDKEQFDQIVNFLIDDIRSMVGKNLVEIKFGDKAITVGVEEVNGDHPEEANFLNVDIKPAGEQPEIHFSFPKGIIFLGAFIGNQFMEQHGEEFFDLIKQHIMMNCMSPMPMPMHSCSEECKEACCAKEQSDSEDVEEEDDDSNDSDEEQAAVEEEHESEEKHEDMKKEIDPEQLKKQILEAILEALK